MSRLFTTSLVSSIDWYKNCPPSWKKKASISLEETLGRIWGTPNKAAQLGIDFEKTLYKFLERLKTEQEISNLESSIMFKEILLRYFKTGAEIQKKVKRFIKIKESEYCLYGKLDIYYPALIVDIKTTSKLMKDYSHKYLSSFQHHMYCYITEIPRFNYFVVIFDENKKIIKTVKIEYHSIGMDYERKIIEQKITDVFSFFGNHPDLLKLYSEKFCLY